MQFFLSDFTKRFIGPSTMGQQFYRDPRIMVEIDPFLLLCSCPDSTFHSNLNCRLETIKHMVQTDPQIYARGREKQSVSHFSVREM